jgi:predicted anti-sigma-YlaC factor YlaD
MKVMLDCKEVSRLISDGQDQDMPPAERARMRLHFVMCQTCRNVDEQMGFLRRAMRQLGREEPDVGDRPLKPPP